MTEKNADSGHFAILLAAGKVLLAVLLLGVLAVQVSVCFRCYRMTDERRCRLSDAAEEDVCVDPGKALRYHDIFGGPCSDARYASLMDVPAEVFGCWLSSQLPFPHGGIAAALLMLLVSFWMWPRRREIVPYYVHAPDRRP